jgi:hypothetical protein
LGLPIKSAEHPASFPNPLQEAYKKGKIASPGMVRLLFRLQARGISHHLRKNEKMKKTVGCLDCFPKGGKGRVPILPKPKLIEKSVKCLL